MIDLNRPFIQGSVRSMLSIERNCGIIRCLYLLLYIKNRYIIAGFLAGYSTNNHHDSVTV